MTYDELDNIIQMETESNGGDAIAATQNVLFWVESEGIVLTDSTE